MNNCSKYKNKQFSSRKQSNSSDYTHLALFYLMNFFKSLFLNSLSPKSDQHEISPYYIHASENRVVMRIGYMIREEESNWYVSKFFPLLLLSTGTVNENPSFDITV